MKTLRLMLILAVIAAAGFAGGLAYSRWSAAPLGERVASRVARYHCPMHPHYTSDEPGTCPICGMKLVTGESSRPGSPHDAARAGAGEAAEGTQPAGAFHVSLEKQQLIGVTYGHAEIVPADRTLRAMGTVAVDETRITKVHTRVDGWIESVSVDFTGKPVRAGQRLLTIYSPDLLATQQELLLALRHRHSLPAGVGSGVVDDGSALVEAARRRLQLWGLTDEQIDEVAQSGKPIVQVPVLSPVTGHVLTRNAFPGQRVAPETELYALADLSTVWIIANLFEGDAPLVRPGMAVRISVPSTGRHATGRVSFIDPHLDPATRTLKLRIETPNPGEWLKPDMFIDVEVLAGGEQRLTVPAGAVLDSGTRQVVFVDRGQGFLEPRKVQLGERTGDRVVVAAGLSPGERIVTSGTFLIDSESQLKSVTAATADQAAPAVPGGHQHAAPGAHQHD